MSLGLAEVLTGGQRLMGLRPAGEKPKGYCARRHGRACAVRTVDPVRSGRLNEGQ
jgi:hypothetical protein